MRRFKLYISLLMGFLLSNSLFAQQKWSLERCIEYAKENNLQVKQQQISIEQAGNNLLASKMEYAPTVNASMNHNLNWGKSVNLNDLEIIENKLSQSTSLNISAGVPVFEGFRKQNTIKSSHKELEIAQMNLESLKDNISISITQAYLQVLLSQKIEESARQSYNSVEQQVAKSRALVDAGSQAYSSLLEIEAQLSNERVQLINAKNNVRANLLTLAQLLDLENPLDFAIEEPQFGDISLTFSGNDIDEIYNYALNLPRIKSVEMALENSKLQYKIQKGAALPTISINAGYGTYYSDSQDTPFFKQFDYNRNPSMGFGLSIPIFNNWRSNTAIRNARLNIKNSQIELEKAHQMLLKDIQQAYNEAVSCYEKYLAAKQNVESAKESFNHTQERFNLGMVNGTDYIVAKTNLFKSESELYQSEYQLIFQMKILDYYRGYGI